MSRLRRLVLVRHGETDGNSSVRFHGSGDVPLSEEGRAQMRALRARLAGGETCEIVVASPLRRSWEGAWILAGGSPVRLEADFREIDFGRWEGLTAEEIEERDPVLYEDWQAQAEGFEYPGGEHRKDFVERVHRGLERLQQSGANSALLVLHKGVIRTIAEKLVGRPLAAGEPPLGAAVWLTRGSDDTWHVGRRSTNPPGLDEEAA